MHQYQNHTDEELVALLSSGDQSAFEAIYRRYATDLYRYVRKNISTKEDCEEMIQDVFESLWVRHDHLKIESLSHYLFNSVRYMVLRYFHHKGVKKRYIEHYKLFAALYDSADQEERDHQTLQGMLIKCLAGLPDRCQMAIKLRITENLPNGEIARRMNITKKTVELYMSKALHHLRVSFPQMYKVS